MGLRRIGVLAAALGLATALLAVTFGVATSSAPAGNRDPLLFFDDFPGPHEVTFGKNVAYTASLTNSQGTSTFTHVVFKMTAPVTKVNGQDKVASLKYASCEPSRTTFPTFAVGGSYSCPEFPQVPSGGGEAKITLVWQALNPEDAPVACDADKPTQPPVVTDSCTLSAGGTWTMKESNNTTPSPDTFDAGTVTTKLLVQPDPKQSGGYGLQTVKAADCTTTTANLVTNLSVGASNKLATAVCAGTLPGTTLNPGVAIVIDESQTPTGLGFTDMSKICIPKPGFECPLTSETNAWPFSPTLATFIFKVPETSDWPPGEKLDLAYHNGLAYEGCTFVRDNKTKIWTVTCPAASNGSWRFG